MRKESASKHKRDSIAKVILGVRSAIVVVLVLSLLLLAYVSADEMPAVPSIIGILLLLVGITVLVPLAFVFESRTRILESAAFRIYKRGIFEENPIFRLALGVCPTLAVTTTAIHGMEMGLATMFVLVCSNAMVSLLRNFIPSTLRVPSFVVIICTFSTVAELLIRAFLPAVYEALGIYLPLIAINCIILARVESFAKKNTVFLSAIDGLGMGLGFTISLVLIASVRELLGHGSLFGFSLLGRSFEPMIIAILPPGAFIIFGLLAGGIQAVQRKRF